MPFAKQLSAVRSQSQTHLPRPIDRPAAPLRISGQGQVARRPLPRWAIIAPAVSRLTFETLVRFAACAGTNFPNVLLAILSWVIGEFLAGCAAYARAMYMIPEPAEDHVEGGRVRAWATPAHGNGSPGARTGLRVIAGTAVESVERSEVEFAVWRESGRQ